MEKFWSAQSAVFHMPRSSKQCGSHVHVTPKSRKKWSKAQLRDIAIGIVYYENQVQKMLPLARRNNYYCQRNSINSEVLDSWLSQRSWHDLAVAFADSDREDIIE